MEPKDNIMEWSAAEKRAVHGGGRSGRKNKKNRSEETWGKQ